MNNQKGFLLLEVMLSLVILTGGLIFVSRSLSSANRLIIKSNELFQYSLLLQEKMSGLELAGEVEPNVERQGFFDKEREYSWKFSSKPLEDPGLCEVELEVFQTKDEPGTSFFLETYLKAKKE